MTQKRKKEFSLDEVVEKIKSVKIQGAENIARAGVMAYAKEPSRAGLRKLLRSRPTEPLLQNLLRAMKKSSDKKKAAQILLRKVDCEHKKMVRFGARLIKKDMNVYTHCHSSSVIDILRYAKKVQRKKFVVYTTEVEPLLQGRMSARDLSKGGIKVVVAPDLAAEQILRSCDILLFGADAFTKKYLANKIGTSALVFLAKKYKIPSYSCTISLKFTKKIKLEMRKPSELWHVHNKNIKIENPAFDKIKINEIDGIVSEFGVLAPRDFVRLARKNLKKLSSILP